MPALVVCGHRTFVAGDDLRVFTIFALTLRLLQLAVLIPLTAVTAGSYGNAESTSPDRIYEICGTEFKITGITDHSRIVFITYITASYILAVVGILIELGIWKTGSRGTPTQPEQRACLEPLCHFKLGPMSILRLGVMSTGIMSIVIIQDYCRCGTKTPNYELCPRYNSWVTYLTILIISHFIEGFVVAMFGLWFVQKSRPKLPNMVHPETKWKICCKACCTISSVLTCCLMGGNDNRTGDFTDIAVIVSDFFDSGGKLDVVASDIIIGLKVLARVQRQKEVQCREELLQKSSLLNLTMADQGLIRDMKAKTVEAQTNANMMEMAPDKGEEEVTKGSRMVRFGMDDTVPNEEPINDDLKDDSLMREQAPIEKLGLNREDDLGNNIVIKEEDTGMSRTVAYGTDDNILNEKFIAAKDGIEAREHSPDVMPDPNKNRSLEDSNIIPIVSTEEDDKVEGSTRTDKNDNDEAELIPLETRDHDDCNVHDASSSSDSAFFFDAEQDERVARRQSSLSLASDADTDFYDAESGDILNVVSSDDMISMAASGESLEQRGSAILNIGSSNDTTSMAASGDNLVQSGSTVITPELARIALAEARGNQGGARRHLHGARKSVVFQMQRRGSEIFYKPKVREVLSRRNAEDVYAIAEGARFMRLSMAIYTMRMYATQSRTYETICKIGGTGKRWICCGKEDRHFLGSRIAAGFQIGDKLEAKFLELAGLDHMDIVYVQFEEGFARTPYCIAIDHAWKSITVAIRGTMGLDDVVADLTIRPESMEEWGNKCGFDGSGCFAHAGMLTCSEWIYGDLERHGILDKLLSEEESPHLTGYKLRLTGHSLGAGCAAILSFMIKNKYPDLHCLCFSPPGCTLSRNMAESCADYLTSYVLDHDIVPRMSLESMDHLRDGILEMIARMKVTKFQAGRCKPTDHDEDVLLHATESTPHSKFMEQLDEFRAHQEEKKSGRGTRNILLFPPGKIVQLVSTGDDRPSGCCGSSCKSKPKEEKPPYAARWACVNDLAEIVISSHFLDDHSSPNVLRELERTAELFGLSSPFTIADDFTYSKTEMSV